VSARAKFQAQAEPTIVQYRPLGESVGFSKKLAAESSWQAVATPGSRTPVGHFTILKRLLTQGNDIPSLCMGSVVDPCRIGVAHQSKLRGINSLDAQLLVLFFSSHGLIRHSEILDLS